MTHMTQTQELVVLATTKNKELIVPPRSDVDPEDVPPADDPFLYGWRYVEHRFNGTEELARMPLTLEDVIHPQWGDYIVQNKEHSDMCRDLFNGLEIHLADEPNTELLNDTPIDWEEEDLKALCPDISVIRGVEVTFHKGTFYLKQSKGYVVLVLEVTSPSTWRVDVEGKRKINKVVEYARAGILIYIIVHAQQRKEGYPPPITVYRLRADNSYEKLEPDARGWFWIDVIEAWIGPYEDWVSWYDKHENKISTIREEHQARKLAEEKARLAEEKMRDEAAARKLAEDRIRELEALLAAK